MVNMSSEGPSRRTKPEATVGGTPYIPCQSNLGENPFMTIHFLNDMALSKTSSQEPLGCLSTNQEHQHISVKKAPATVVANRKCFMRQKEKP